MSVWTWRFESSSGHHLIIENFTLFVPKPISFGLRQSPGFAVPDSFVRETHPNEDLWQLFLFEGSKLGLAHFL